MDKDAEICGSHPSASNAGRIEHPASKGIKQSSASSKTGGMEFSQS